MIPVADLISIKKRVQSGEKKKEMFFFNIVDEL